MPSPDPLLHQASEACGVDIRTIRRWRQLEGFPHGKPVEEVVAWMKSLGLGEHKKGSKDLGELKAELLREQIEHARHKNQIAAKNTITIEKHNSDCQTATALWQSVLKAKLESEAPSRLLGKPISEIRSEMQLIHDELLAALNLAIDSEPED
jgi:DNA-binding transcriptional MerR regulator